jgi:hypothetical protein
MPSMILKPICPERIRASFYRVMEVGIIEKLVLGIIFLSVLPMALKAFQAQEAMELAGRANTTALQSNTSSLLPLKARRSRP